MISFISYYLLTTYYFSLGLGLVAPIGDLAKLSPVAKEIKVTCQTVGNRYVYSLPKLECKLINLTKDEFNIDIFQISGGAKVKAYKKFHLSTGVGVYHIRAIAKTGGERSNGFCSYYGVTVPYKVEKTNLIIPEITYYTVPRGISFTLNFGISL